MSIAPLIDAVMMSAVGANGSTDLEQELQDGIEALVSACHRLHARGLLAGTEGNCSARLSDGSILITASGIDKAILRRSHVLRRYADGTECHELPVRSDVSHTGTGDRLARPSSEMEMHLCIYETRADVRAIVHAHPPAATGFATAGRVLPNNVLPELPVVVGPVTLVPYARPGTSALAARIRPVAADFDVFLLENHGVTVVGASVGEAVTRMESVEQAARILVVAELLGGARVLPGEEAEALAQLRRTSPQLPPDVLS